jgi:ribosomal protein S18 acetylase RimI-like enzyme
MVDIRRLTTWDLRALLYFYGSLSPEVTAVYQPFRVADLATLEDHLHAAESGSTISTAAFAAERIVGHCFVTGLNAEHPILGLGVHQEHHNRGIGRALLEYVLPAARSDGARCITLTVVKTNAAAIHLYTSYGFAVVGDHSFRRPGDSYFMTLRFAEGTARSGPKESGQ